MVQKIASPGNVQLHMQKGAQNFEFLSDLQLETADRATLKDEIEIAQSSPFNFPDYFKIWVTTESIPGKFVLTLLHIFALASFGIAMSRLGFQGFLALRILFITLILSYVAFFFEAVFFTWISIEPTISDIIAQYWRLSCLILSGTLVILLFSSILFLSLNYDTCQDRDKLLYFLYAMPLFSAVVFFPLPRNAVFMEKKSEKIVVEYKSSFLNCCFKTEHMEELKQFEEAYNFEEKRDLNEFKKVNKKPIEVNLCDGNFNGISVFQKFVWAVHCISFLAGIVLCFIMSAKGAMYNVSYALTIVSFTGFLLTSASFAIIKWFNCSCCSNDPKKAVENSLSLGFELNVMLHVINVVLFGIINFC